jgi:outer membrane receptor protein involved in Fe transport
MTSSFENRGSQTLIPSSDTRNAAVYVFEQMDAGRWRATAGARYDYRTLATAGDAGIGIPEQSREFHAVTGSAGALYRLTTHTSLVANVARGFRAPAAPDLFANGFHEGTRAFERGDPDLDVETSLNVDMGLRFSGDAATAELTAFRNDVNGYIYLRPFGTRGATGSAFDSLEVVQGDARLVGIEGRAAYRPFNALTLQLSGDYVRGDNLAVGVPLTFIPPARVIAGVRVEPRSLQGQISQPYITAAIELNSAQRRIDPRDVATDGYALTSFGAGFARRVPRGMATIDISLRNALDVRYRSFMSRYKEFASGPGRTLVVRASTPF